MGQGTCVAIASQKGGVGKTTLALNLGYALAQRGWKTLLMDTDPQGSLGYSVRGAIGPSGLTSVLERGRTLESAIRRTRLPELQLLPLGPLAPTRAASWAVGLEDGVALSRLLEEARSRWDVVLVDTPPGMSGVALGVLRSADFAVAPMQAEPLAARSLHQLLEVVTALRSEGGRIKLAGLVLTMVQTRQEDSLQVTLEAWRHLPPNVVFETSIPRDAHFLEASAEGTPVALLRARPPAVAGVFDLLAAELEDKIGLEVPDDGSKRAIPLLD